MHVCLLIVCSLLPSQSLTHWPVTGDIQPVSDPAIIQCGEKSYIYCSGRGIPVRVSSDLHHWERLAPVFAEVPQWARDRIPTAHHFWAPDISARDGKFWLYYAVSTLGSRNSVIGLATNVTLDPQDPDYRWIDQGLVWETFESDNYNAIDPNAVEGPGGQWYLAFGSYWSGLKMVEIDRETGKPRVGAELKSIAARPGAEAIEGACIVRRGTDYYLFCSHDFTGRRLESTYKVVVGRAQSPLGPFVDRAGQPLLQGGGTVLVANDAYWRGPGHNAILMDGDKTWIVYHALDPTRNAALTLRIDPVTWSADGWPEVAQGVPPVSGWWEHTVAGHPMQLLHLLPDGTLDASGRTGHWTVEQQELVLNWDDATAANVDQKVRCAVADDRRSYAGRNAAGKEVRGRRAVVGWWEHRVANGAATMVRLFPNGKLNDAAGPASWELRGDTLMLLWPNAAAPGGVWRDTLQVSPDRARYAGQNQNGTPIQAWQVASE